MEEYKMTEKEFIEDLNMTEEFYNKGYFSTNTYYQIKSRIAEEYKNSLLNKEDK